MFAEDPATLLLVEDEAIIALNEKATLEKNGLYVRTVHSGEDALRVAEEDGRIDVILMDIDLGRGMDGTETAQRILEIREVPILFLTSHAEKEMVRKVEGITQYGYVLKSSGEFVLLQAIRNALNLFDAHARLKQRERQFHAAEERLKRILDSAPMGIGIVRNRVIVEANDTVGEMAGRPREELLGQTVRVLYESEEEFRRVGEEKYRQMEELGAGTVQTQWKRKDGNLIDVLLSSAPVQGENQEGEVIFTAFNMTEYKEGERNLQRALTEKEQLMKELNHRVKNNLNMVSSLINLKEAELRGKADLSDIQNQLDAIRTVHEKLAQTDGALTIDLKSYLSELLTSGFHWPYSAPHPEISTEIGEAVVPAKTAASLGLIVNELATNAAKHAFQGVENPRLAVEFSVENRSGDYLLTVRNNGRPFPEHISPEDPSSGGLGLQLISAMVASLEGEIFLEREPETTITVRIPSSGDGRQREG